MNVAVLNGLIKLFRRLGPVCVCLFICVLEILALQGLTIAAHAMIISEGCSSVGELIRNSE